ncbi:hypothetical protein EJB05_38979, partial [Eragrostis curvula]
MSNSDRRNFSPEVEAACWKKGKEVPGREPDRWRLDCAGNYMFKPFHGCHGSLCYEFDHIDAHFNKGPSTLANCQPLQTKLNKSKSKYNLSSDQMVERSADIKPTTKELNIVEFSFYGNIIEDGQECRCLSEKEQAGINILSQGVIQKFRFRADKT